MSTSTSRPGAFSLAGLVAHMQAPLYRNGYALVLSSATTSALGVVYWILAARNYSTEVVGLNSAALSAILFLSSMSQLNLMSALNRFIPSAGRETGRLVVYSILISLVVALIASTAFILGVNIWAPVLSFVGSNPIFTAWFTLAVMAWCVFVLQDAALTGLRQATWVPVENTVFAVLKIVLLLALAGVFPRYGILASWTLPLLVTLLPVNRLLFRRLIPQHVQATQDTATPPTPRQIGRYIAGDYLGSLIWYATTSFLPVLVAVRAGATANAYFYLSWTIAYSFYLVSLNMGQSLIAEGAADQTQLDNYSYRMFVQTVRLLVPMVVVMLVGAPYILRVFGASYSAEGTLLLRLLSLSALPNIVTSLYTSMARVQRRMRQVVLVLSLLSVMVLALGYVLMGIYGISGIGVAWLVSQSIMAGYLLIRTHLRVAWLSRLDIQFLVRWSAGPRAMWWHLSHRRRVAAASRAVARILPTITPLPGLPPPAAWTTQYLVHTVNDVLVVALGVPGEPPVGMLKLAETTSAVEGLRRQKATLQALQSDPRLADWCSLLPTILADDMTDAYPFIVERMLPGVESRRLVANPAVRERLQTTAVASIGELHRRTARLLRVDDALLRTWIDEPLARLGRMAASGVEPDGQRPALDRLAVELHAELAGRQVAVSWVHGDFVPGNILATPDGSKLTGIVDWELASSADLPLLDVIQLLVSTRTHVQQRELGDVLPELLGDAWTVHERGLLAGAQQRLPGEPVNLRTLLLLSWLRHVDSNLSKSTRYAHHRIWMARNVNAVLMSVLTDRAPSA
jgi:aminoglycoside phosphotransferase (APT) family kinase protein/O-antigen/teichoic acid export membrane protein